MAQEKPYSLYECHPNQVEGVEMEEDGTHMWLTFRSGLRIPITLIVISLYHVYVGSTNENLEGRDKCPLKKAEKAQE